MTWASVPASGAGMSSMGPMMGQDFAGVAPGEAFFFAHGELARVADDASLGAAEGEINQGVFPGLEHRQGHDFVAIDRDVVADAALERPAGVAVLGAIAGEDLDFAVVHADWAGDRQDAFGAGEDLPPDRVEVHRLIDAVEIFVGVLPELGMFRLGGEEVGVGHGLDSLPPDGRLGIHTFIWRACAARRASADRRSHGVLRTPAKWLIYGPEAAWA